MPDRSQGERCAPASPVVRRPMKCPQGGQHDWMDVHPPDAEVFYCGACGASWRDLAAVVFEEDSAPGS